MWPLTRQLLPALALALLASGCQRCGRVPPVNTAAVVVAPAAQPSASAAGGSVAPQGTQAQPLPKSAPESEQPDACLDRVLQQAGLNRFGDPPDTMYAGGSPLFDETSGRTVARREYVARRHPELVARCPTAIQP